LPSWSWAVRAGRTPVLARLSITTTPYGLLLLWSERSERVPRRAGRAASRRLLRIPGGRLLRVSGRRLLRVSVRRRLLPRAGTNIRPLAWHRWLRPPFIPLSPLIPSRTVRVVRAHGSSPDPLFLVSAPARATLAIIRASSMERTLVSEPVSCAPDGAK